MTERRASEPGHATGGAVPDAHGWPAAGRDSAGHGGGEERGHDQHGAATRLGPIDWPMWGAGALGVAVAIVMTAAFMLAARVGLPG